MAPLPRASFPPVAPERDAPQLRPPTASVPEIVEAASMGLLGLLLGLLPVAAMFLLVNWLRLQIPDVLSMPLIIVGVLFAGMCAGYLAAWRLRPHGVRGRRLAGQLAVLFLEALVILAVLVPTGLETEPADCPFGCFSGDKTITAMAVIGWPVAAVGALTGSHLFVRRLLERGLVAPGSEISQRSQ